MPSIRVRSPANLPLQEEQRPMGVPQHLASIFAAPEAVSASTTMPGGSTLQIEKSAPATIAEYATKTLPALRSRSSSRVQAHCLRTVRDSQGFLTAPRANSTGPIIFNPSDTASLSPIVSRPAFMDGTEHHEEVVDYLDVIDPQVGTVSGLTNAANALLFPPFQSLSRKPTLVLSPLPNDQGDGRSSIYNENTLDRHVEDILSRPSKFRRTLLGILSFIQTPMGIVTAVYGFLVVFWGAAIVMFASKIIDLHDPGLQGFWIEVSSQIVNGLFSVTGIGLIPSRVLDTYRICKIWHYKGRTKAFRAKAGLPQLSDVDDLPDPAYDSNYVHVLTEEEQRDLHQQQVKFQHHQTWYRPHGTETHRAFPINTALLICLLNDGNSVFQIILCAVMWGFNRFNRPSWTTATFIPCAFSCGILSAILIWRGGQKTKRVKEVQEKLRAVLAEPDKGVQNAGTEGPIRPMEPKKADF